ncbi:capsular polysaccharide biosynthesis protein [Listeria weihenstephanensis FSL R9-0317]|uniref:polysaccharide biosynthesis protein n=2 Tax=Listeria weihenstephanensis TaxID=1006155 RepID=UPI0003E86080|nr:polysaccharide biosynthesis protein [Listeria weihenstephanensis]EUJ38775.1 capsular polysaccharide biosynthesis protein [Listeria weihenstephanensis FSL R9-0317]
MKMMRTLIIGAGAGGEFVIEQLQTTKNSRYQPVVILDDDTHKVNSELNGVPIVGNITDLRKIIMAHTIEHVILAIPTLNVVMQSKIIDQLRDSDVTLFVLPSVFSTMQSQKVAIPELDYGDLIQNRSEFQLDYQDIQGKISQKTVLITGAGGSIGSEIAHQIFNCYPKRIILLGHGEGSIYQIDSELQQEKLLTSREVEIIPVIADIRDDTRMTQIFKKYMPNIVYHAAAHKHVPLMENNIYEAIKNNVIGTHNVIQASKLVGTEEFVMVSTDKAVNPKNIMGATKRLAEKLTLETDTTSKTICNVVRFGNVLGSRGSVFPKLWNQIHQGTPLTITNSEMKRYFMTIPEASKLVISASMLKQRNAIFVLDMGEQLGLSGMVDQLIKLSGKNKRDILIQYIGVRPGEKMEEELFNQEELSSKVSDKMYEGNYYTSITELNAVKELMRNYATIEHETLRDMLLTMANQHNTLQETM